MLEPRLLGDSMRRKGDTLSLQGGLKSPREACLGCLSSGRWGERPLGEQAMRHGGTSLGTSRPHGLLVLTLRMHTLGHKWHEGAAQMPHHIHMQLPWPPIINIATPHQARRRTITETSTQLACSGLLREGSIQNITYFFPSLAREGTNLSYISEGMAHPFLHLSINLQRQGVPTKPR